MPTTTLERLAFGVTSIIYRCRACGFTRTLEVLGDARIPKSEARP